MLSLYVFALILGGVLLGISLLGGHHGGDSQTAELGHGATTDDHPASAEEHGSDTHPSLAHSLLPLVLSIRSWTYLLAFGGATGLLLRWLGQMGEPTAALISLAVGLISGGLGQILVGRATRMGTDSALTQRDMIGRVATVLVPFSGTQTGKIRLQVKDTTLDLLALSTDGRDLRQRDEVVVLEINDGRAMVSAVSDLEKR